MRTLIRKFTWRHKTDDARQGKTTSGHLDQRERNALFTRFRKGGLPK